MKLVLKLVDLKEIQLVCLRVGETASMLVEWMVVVKVSMMVDLKVHMMVVVMVVKLEMN